MAIAQQRRLAGRLEPFGVNQRVLVLPPRDNLHRLKTHLTKIVGHELGRALDVGFMLGECGDAGNAKKRFETFKISIVILLEVSK
jgi:hypothetical protein